MEAAAGAPVLHGASLPLGVTGPQVCIYPGLLALLQRLDNCTSHRGVQQLQRLACKDAGYRHTVSFSVPLTQNT